MSFHEVRFPTDLSFGATGGPERRTEIVALVNGFEERNTPWAQSRRRYDAGLGLRSLADLGDLIAFFEARQGRLYGFRWKDWADHSSAPHGQPPAFEDQQIGTGDGSETEFQLTKTYLSGGVGHARAITKPVAGSVLIGVDGAAQSGGVTIDSTTGLVRFDTPPGAGQVVTAGFAFDVPVRFDTDYLAIRAASFEAGEVPDIPVVEIRT